MSTPRQTFVSILLYKIEGLDPRGFSHLTIRKPFVRRLLYYWHLGIDIWEEFYARKIDH